MCFSYWFYLIFTSQMLIRYDASVYEELGRMIYSQGWIEYFKTGPNREPLYPLTIAVSMKIADIFATSYQLIQKTIQVMILFITQILLFKLLSRLEIKNVIKLAVVLYFGLSPAIVNSAFSLFSEIITYPFVLAIILMSLLSWQAVHRSSFRRIVALSLLTSLLFVLSAFAKGVFQYIFLFFLIPYFFVFINSIRIKNKGILLRSATYITLALLIFNSLIIPFKLLNKKFNDHFEFTNRYVAVLFGNAAKRVNPALSPRLVAAHLASIPGGGVCRWFFSEDECRYCEFYLADDHPELPSKKDISGDKRRAKILSLTIGKIGQKPMQYFLFMGIEALRMPFWESTQIGYVNYPSWLKRLFELSLFKNGLRTLTSLFTFLGLFYLIGLIFKHKKKLFDLSGDGNPRLIICFFTLLIIFSYTGLYAFFSIVTRYSLVIVSLYLTGIAYFINQKLLRSWKLI
ncbi:MAG: hypothetical protein KKH93_03465 [Candidatus Omnitrophica bacterium]|nr:hypothetical protein [Candidatus Omnitrophota bacterium]